MRDGTRLCADICLPRKPGKYPAVMSRTPYGRNANDFFAARGYAVISVDARGTGASGGGYDYYNMTEGLHDGYDIVEWIATQSFCDGNVGTIGDSALGIYQILTGCFRPPHLRCMIASCYPLDFYTDQWYPGGVLRTENRIAWCTHIQNMTSPGRVSEQNTPDLPTKTRAILDDIYRERFAMNEQTLRKEPGEWFNPYFANRKSGKTWDKICLEKPMRQVRVPVMHTCMLYDHFGIGTLRGFLAHKGKKKLYIIPGSLGFEGHTGSLDFNAIHLEWFDYHLKNKGEPPYSPAVCAFSTGAEKWLEFAEYPKTEPDVFYLTSSGKLQKQPSQGKAVLAHNPAKPALSKPAGRNADYREFENQPQCLTFTSPAFKSDTCVTGNPVLNLRVAASMADANIIARLSAVYPDGRSRQLNFGALKLSLRESLSHARPVRKNTFYNVRVNCWTLSHTFTRGQKLRLTLSLSDYPFFENSPLSGKAELETGKSSLELPVIKMT